MIDAAEHPEIRHGAQGGDLSIPSLRAALRDARQASIQRFEQDQQVGRLLRGLARETDAVMQQLWARFAMPADWSLFAVGGYGRAELQPYSDVDLLLLTPAEPDGAGVDCIQGFIGACWDIGLEIGHSVRTPAACVDEARADLTVMTALLERRLIAGSRKTARELAQVFDGLIEPARFLRDKLLEMRSRHQKFEDTPYSLEPNCKESPGALRDLQVIAWVSRGAGLAQGWSGLVREGVIEPFEASQLQRHERLLKRIRAWLHIVAGRREDRLVFDLQPVVAKRMGLAAEGSRALSEALMQRYYLAAKAITQLSTILLQTLEQRLTGRPPAVAVPLDADFDRIEDRLDLHDPNGFERDPRLMLRLFLMMQAHPELKGISTPTLRALWHARFHIDAKFRRDPDNRKAFLDLLKAPRGVTHELRRMNQWSVLGRYLPAFRKIVGRMQHDLFHVYTVDQHILMVVRNLRRFSQAEHAHEYPLCSQLIATFEDSWLLIVAALFHDIAKGRGGDHSTLGEHDATRFCRMHGIHGKDRQLVRFLVRHHLSMSTTAQKKDLTDPDEIAAFARLVGEERHLVALYLLTVADIRGTSAKVWNAWKGKLLEDLFRATRAQLAGKRVRPLDQLDSRRSEAARLLLLFGIDRPSYQAFWNGLDIGYFLRHEAHDIAWHTRILHTLAAPTSPIVRTRLSPIGEGFEVLVYTRDQPGLFARICSYFDRKNLSILEARVHTTRTGYALDSFIVVDPDMHLAYRDVLTLVEVELAEVLQRPFKVDELKPAVPARRSRRSRAFPLPPLVELRPDESGRRFHLSVTSTDRTGLLYDIARILAQHGIDLFGARVATLGERAEDVFSIDARELSSDRARQQLERELLAVL